MKKLILSLALLSATSAFAQRISCASQLKANRKSDVTLPFRYTDPGKETPIEWGVDVAWLDEANVRTAVFFAGKEVIDMARTSFRPTESVEGGALSTSQLKYLKDRAAILKKWLKTGVGININSDPGDGDTDGVNPWYNASGTTTMRGQRWAKCIDLHYDAYKTYGLTNIVSISPFNEPDFGWGQGLSSATRMADMKAVCKSLKEDFDGKYDGVRICGGNTLNDDRALEWWTYLKDYLDEGNTHQLAGDFDHYADFFKAVREANMHATADELHNTMEAMVGVEYGMQTGIWWGTAEYTRGQFMKATYKDNPGRRLGYAEHRNNWTAASVYRHADGSVQGFAGTSERQAVATSYNFLALDRPVWYDGLRGRDFLIELPGGTGYQQGQTNAETLVNIQGDDDVMPHVGEGTYKILNVNSGMVMGFPFKPTGWTSVAQRKSDNSNKGLQWNLKPNEKDGDFYYFTLYLNTPVTNNELITLDILNWNYDGGADVGGYPQSGNPGSNEQWYLQYAGNNAFYIRSRYSNKCLEVVGGKKTSGANIQMGEFKGETYQQWRFIPIKVTPDLVAPASPTGLKATPNNASVTLTWDANEDKDFKSYTILRSDDGTSFYTLANELTTNEFTDNEANDNSSYIYKVYAEDLSLNRSEASDVVSAQPSAEAGLVMSLPLTENFYDVSTNGNHCAIQGDTVFTTYKEHSSLALNGTSQFVQLPYTVANHDELSISMWVYYRGGSQWQRIFDFGNGTDQYMFLSPNCGSGMRFAIKNGGDEQQMSVSASLSTTRWHNIIVTLGAEGGKLYVDGVLKAENKDINIKPSDIMPVANFIGRSQFPADPLFKGYIHDLRIYNYPLSPAEVTAINDGTDAIVSPAINQASSSLMYDLSGKPASRETRGIIIKDGRKTVRK